MYQFSKSTHLAIRQEHEYSASREETQQNLMDIKLIYCHNSEKNIPNVTPIVKSKNKILQSIEKTDEDRDLKFSSFWALFEEKTAF
jgi:hypothetical protein